MTTEKYDSAHAMAARIAVLEARIAVLEARIAVLEAALMPFNDAYLDVTSWEIPGVPWSDSTKSEIYEGCIDGVSFDDFLAAAVALNPGRI